MRFKHTYIHLGMYALLQYEMDGYSGVILVLYSAVLSRTIQE